ncbi:unnamed protein product [Brachionus calyciflorus]|uniref:AAA domain-containing protein n=1 Tax=Brachionus calyciflorus TaxID=104777 RepID=A0A813P809_9BILA|nr:unnamed protein product [Brachionus calyciflorus]
MTENQEKNVKIFSFYAEKGGVGKTTLCITLASKFSQMGKRVLIYDCDAQRSLTSWIFGDEIQRKFGGHITNFINQNVFPRTLYDQMIDPTCNKTATAIKVRNHNLFIVPGSHDTNKLDGKISFDETLSNGGYGLTNVNNVTGKPYNCIMSTAKAYEADYVFLDLSSYAGVLNRCLIMTSNYLIIPTTPDFFSYEMFKNMEKILKNWDTDIEKMRESTRRGLCPLPEKKMKFLGYILSRYIPLMKGEILNGIACDSLRAKEEIWVNQINQQAKELTTKLSELNLARISFFKNISDELHLPVHLLTTEDFKLYSCLIGGENKAPQNNEMYRVEEFSVIFDEIAKTIELVTEEDNRVSI